jgi:hypothetical protein
VKCVLVAVLLTAAFSSYPIVGGLSGVRPLASRARLGERSGAGVIAITRSKKSARYQFVACDVSAGFDESDISRIGTMSGKGGPQYRVSRNAIDFCTTESMPGRSGKAKGES